MAGDRNKWEAQQNGPRVQAILMREWDPIGVRGIPKAQDEYDSYVDAIAAMLTDERVTRAAIVAHLFEIATQRMGLSAKPWLSDRCDKAAGALVAMRPRFEPKQCP